MFLASNSYKKRPANWAFFSFENPYKPSEIPITCLCTLVTNYVNIEIVEKEHKKR
jgi:hypothetical protein